MTFSLIFYCFDKKIHKIFNISKFTKINLDHLDFSFKWHVFYIYVWNQHCNIFFFF